MLQYFKWVGLGLLLAMWLGFFLPALISGTTIQIWIGIVITLFFFVPFVYWIVKD